MKLASLIDWLSLVLLILAVVSIIIQFVPRP